MSTQPAEPNPASIIRAADGRVVQLKVHRALWSGAFPENSLPAIEECYREAVARTEIDLHLLRDADFLVLHDQEIAASTTGSGPVGNLTRRDAQALRLRFQGGVSAERPPLFSEVAALIREQAYPTLVELDIPGLHPLPWPRVEELARMLAPVRDRVILNGVDWNLRRILEVDNTLPVSFDPWVYLDWVPEGDPEEQEIQLPRGAYGYFDAHPLAQERLTSVADYLADRLGGISRLVPGVREAHVRLGMFERMLDDGVEDAAALFHRQHIRLDVWTLNAGMPHWEERLARLLGAGVDSITTDTAQALAAAAGMDSRASA